MNETNIMTVANIILACVNAVLVYYGIRRSSKIARYSQFVDIIKKSDIWIKMKTMACNEIIEVANNGENPINKVELEISLVAKKGDETIPLGNVKFIRDNILRPTESFQIPLHEKLGKILQNFKLLIVREEEIPSGKKHLLTGEEIFTKIYVKHLLKEFDLNVKIELSYEVFQEKINIGKQYNLQYRFEPDFIEDPLRYQFDDNYNITIHEISGKWVDSSES